MAIQATCPKCQHEYKLRNRYAGATVRCGECSAPFQVEANGEDGAAITPLKRPSPGVAIGFMVGTFILIIGVCIGLPVLALMLFGKSGKPHQQPVAAKQNPKETPGKPAGSDEKAKENSASPGAREEKPKENPPQAKPGDGQAAEYVKQLDDADPKVREKALKELGKLKDLSTIPAIARRLTDAKDRRFASDALKGFGSVAEPDVVNVLQEKDKAVRIEACRILNKIGTKASMPLLEETAKAKEQDVAKEAQNAIKEINKRGL
jgi:hypothetical protein